MGVSPRVVTSAAAIVAALLLLPRVVPAQSLGEVAAQEKQRREKAKTAKPARTYGDYELRNAGGRTASVPASEASSEPASAEAKPEGDAAPTSPKKKKEKTEDEVRAEQQKAWQERLQKANAEVARLTAEVDRLQTAANNISGNIYSASRTSLLGQLETAKSNLAAGKQSVADLEDEGRRNRY